MYKPSAYLFLYLRNIWDLFPIELITKVKPNINSVEVHPQLSNNGYSGDGALVSAGSLVAGKNHSISKDMCQLENINWKIYNNIFNGKNKIFWSVHRDLGELETMLV